MAESSDQEKTEEATPKKREDSRKKGQVGQSREIPSVMILMTTLMVLSFVGSYMFNSLSELMTFTYENAGTFEVEPSTMAAFMKTIFGKVILILAPIMLGVMITGVVSNVAQFGFLFTTDPLTPNLSKLNPVQGIKRLFSLKSLVELIKSVLKLLVVGSISYLVLAGELDNIPGLMRMDVNEILIFIGSVAFDIILYVCLVLILLAAMDFAYQRWQYEKDLKMTKQEVKDEGKEREGDPQIKARIRAAQHEMARRRMMEKVPEADVVITNPTHLAVALKFDPTEMIAPRVIAKGADLVAQKIKKIAKENNVPVLEDKPLAQTLFKAVEIDEYIPADLYRAVAEVLAYVYRLSGKRPKRR